MASAQRLLVFQQNDSGERKVAGIRRYGGNGFDIQIETIDSDLPPLLDDTTGLFPPQLNADLALDFMYHPDLSHDLALLCARRRLPLVASGKHLTVKGVLTPPV